MRNVKQIAIPESVGICPEGANAIQVWRMGDNGSGVS